MTTTRLLARNAVLNLVTLTVPLIVAVITVPLMIRGMGPERFGILSIAWVLLTYLSELGVGTATTYYGAAAIGAGRDRELGAVIWTTTALQCGVGLVLGIALAVAAPFLVGHALKIPPALADDARTALYILAASLPLLGCARSFRGVIEAAQRFDVVLLVQLPITTASYVLAAMAAHAGWSVAGVVTIIVAVRLLALPAYYVAARRALANLSWTPTLHWSKLREVASFAGWAAVSTIVSPLLLYLDRFMIGALLSMAAVTYYAAPYEIVARLVLIPGAVAGALFPALSQLHARAAQADSEQLAVRCITMLIAVLAPVIIFALGSARDLLTIWLGPEYAAQSATALQILAVGVFINAMAHVPYVLLHSARRPDVPARFHLLELPIQVVLAWVLISNFGITGAALAWTLRMTIDAGLLFWAAGQNGLLRRRAWRAQLIPITTLGLAVAGFAAVAAASSITSGLMRVGVATGLAVASALLLWSVALSDSERQRITALFRPAT